MGRRVSGIRAGTAFTTIDFDRPGRQVGFVMIPHSPHDDAWGVTRVPIAILANGNGPTVVIEGDKLRNGNRASARIAEGLYRKALGDGAQSVTAAIFRLKTRAGWKETSVQELNGPAKIEISWVDAKV